MDFVAHLQSLPTQLATVSTLAGAAVQRYRVAGVASATALPVVLLHGIGSGSASWVVQLDGAAAQGGPQVLAWDAPGYADSTPLPALQPGAQDYGQRLWDWLDALGVHQVRLVGHSLGCIMAAGAARLQPGRIASLTLLAPAQGYARASEAVRTRKRDERLQALASHGAAGLAALRGPALLSPHATAQQVALAVHLMSQLHTAGYTQATHLLAHADITADLQAFSAASGAALTVACGALDTITPAGACQALAQSVGGHYVPLGNVGHLCALEAGAAVNALLGLAQERA
jgi:pimeloyl-ACP methyl ester carboxylesterase